MVQSLSKAKKEVQEIKEQEVIRESNPVYDFSMFG